MTDAERLKALREKYRGLQGDMPPFGDVIFLLRLLDDDQGRWFRSARPSRWRHRKRGTSYNVLTATAGAQCATGPINEGDHVTVYQGDDENWHVRKTDEFQDGRFERIDQNA